MERILELMYKGENGNCWYRYDKILSSDGIGLSRDLVGSSHRRNWRTLVPGEINTSGLPPRLITDIGTDGNQNERNYLMGTPPKRDWVC